MSFVNVLLFILTEHCCGGDVAFLCELKIKLSCKGYAVFIRILEFMSIKIRADCKSINLITT